MSFIVKLLSAIMATPGVSGSNGSNHHRKTLYVNDLTWKRSSLIDEIGIWAKEAVRLIILAIALSHSVGQGLLHACAALPCCNTPWWQMCLLSVGGREVGPATKHYLGVLIIGRGLWWSWKPFSRSVPSFPQPPASQLHWDSKTCAVGINPGWSYQCSYL